MNPDPLKDARTIGEEWLGAELVAGKELTEAAGTLLDTIEKGSAIWLQQARWLAGDYGRFWLASVTPPPDQAPLTALIDSRTEHITSGLHQFGELIEKEFTPLTKIWTDFLGVVAQDWRKP